MALAPEQVRRIGFRRHFTTPDVHPYDTVEWERREARIPDYKTGGDAFYQPDVEFPATWSQNATNIVAQKYFRGPLGSPEREWSLRQIIDRVADTITAWGLKDGYFVDDEEAECFRAELKYLLLHQRASFNSPVWFNIGVPGEPAQASACFILSVDDTMDSILNWYREEGIIFKGGSGSGVNLSKIRSSLEPLRGGGTASGPVSFMRGADASAGTIKCLHEDTLIVTDRGVMPIREVHAGDRVLTRFGFGAVEAVHDNGVRPLVRVRTSLGDEVLCTPEHRFWVRGRDGTGWREAGQLRPDDELLVDLSAPHYGDLQPLEDPGPEHPGERSPELPPVLDERLATWLGWTWGAGQITTGGRTTVIDLELRAGEPERFERYTALTRAVFGDGVRVTDECGRDRPRASVRVDCASTRVARFLGANGLWREGAERGRVPLLVQSSPPGVRAAFLAGLFEALGHGGAGSPWLSARSRGVAVDVHRMLLSLGIPSVTSPLGDPPQGDGDAPVWTVRVVGDQGVWRFAKLVGFVSEHEQRALEEALAGEDCRGSGARRSPSHGSDRLPDAATVEPLSDLARGEELYVRATVEPAGEGRVYDLTVAEHHQYLVHGLVTHNSGGKTRRAAKMVILNADHPDIEEFIWCKAVEERKARALSEAGFDVDLDGKDSYSLQYQNANNSVRVTDDFMQAVLDDADWELKAVTTGETLKTVKARDLMRQIAQAAWECADPGMQFDTTINDWNTAANTGRINASNPCFTGDTYVHTDRGLVRFAELVRRVQDGQAFGVYTHDATRAHEPAERVEVTRPEAFMVTGWNEVVRLRFSNGMEVRCTPNHRFWTVNRGYVRADELTGSDEVKVLDVPTPATAADPAIPEGVTSAARGGECSPRLRLPEKWTPELAHYLGWLVGAGSLSGDAVSTTYGTREEQEHLLPLHRRLLGTVGGGREPTPRPRPDGAVELRHSRRAILRFLEALGVSTSGASAQVVPWAVEQAPPEIQAAFLRGLFDAGGGVDGGDTGGSVWLRSSSVELLRGVQRMLSAFGVGSRVDPADDSGERFVLRVADASGARFAAEVGFTTPSEAAKLGELVAASDVSRVAESVRLVERVDDGVELTYNLSEPRNHSYIVNGLVVANCSEYMHLDNSACNLASINLLKYLNDDGSFDVEGFTHTVEVIFTAQEILVGNADYPTPKIGENARAFREIGLGYANLGALLMARGLPYDSDEGRAWSAAITALMTGHAYATSARIAARMGPFAGYAVNREPMLRVLNKHRAAAALVDEELVPPDLLDAARRAWDEACELAETYGVRNSQASVLAPTGCLVGGVLVPTEHGLLRLGSLGDPTGDQWQPLGIDVMTDEGPRRATQFYVNGVEPVVHVTTRRGYELKGTAKHRIKVVDRETGEWVWRRLADLRPGDTVPLALDQVVGTPHVVELPPLPEAQRRGEDRVELPRTMTPELAELVGYFAGKGSLHSGGLRFSVDREDFEVAEHLALRAKSLFGTDARLGEAPGSVEVALDSVGLAEWWRACGFASCSPTDGNGGEGETSRIPTAVLASNDAEVYRAFLRGLFEAGGTVGGGRPQWSTTSLDLSAEVQTLLLALGYPTVREVEVPRGQSGGLRGDAPVAVVRILNPLDHERWLAEVGFLSGRRRARVRIAESHHPAGDDRVPVTRELIDRVAAAGGAERRLVLMEHRRHGSISRRLASKLHAATGDPELGHLLRFSYDEVATAEWGEEELTYDLSVPDNTTYIAGGFVSHNTIGLALDCDTTGIEPDLALTKTKKLVGGGTMEIVNRTVPRALRTLGYTDEQVAEIEAYIDTHKSIVGAPHVKAEHLPVFATAMGDNVIHYMGHIRMMAAVQPFISGAISKTVNVPEETTVEELENLFIEAWRLGLKAVAVYRDNCKVAQPLASQKRAVEALPAAADEPVSAPAVAAPAGPQVETIILQQPVRQRLPRRRASKTFKFQVADCEGYMTVGEFEDGRPGEIFLKVAKQGSTLAGIMDSFAIAVSIGLQHGVPLKTYVEKYTNTRFEPAGLTDDKDIRFASSLVDYIFRRLAIEYLPYEERAELGIFTVDERTQPTLPGVEEGATTTTESVDLAHPELQLEPPAPAAGAPPPTEGPAVKAANGSTGTPAARKLDAPICYSCGAQMVPSGSCYVCTGCGSTSGCS